MMIFVAQIVCHIVCNRAMKINKKTIFFSNQNAKYFPRHGQFRFLSTPQTTVAEKEYWQIARY